MHLLLSKRLRALQRKLSKQGQCCSWFTAEIDAERCYLVWYTVIDGYRKTFYHAYRGEPAELVMFWIGQITIAVRTLHDNAIAAHSGWRSPDKAATCF